MKLKQKLLEKMLQAGIVNEADLRLAFCESVTESFSGLDTKYLVWAKQALENELRKREGV